MPNKNAMMNMKGKIFIIGVCFCISACESMNSQWYPDASEGTSVRAAIRAQSVYPDGKPNPTNTDGMSGVVAKATIDGYVKSFVIPTLPPLPVGTGTGTAVNTTSGGVGGSTSSPSGF
jgi:hypothetical protein